MVTLRRDFFSETDLEKKQKRVERENGMHHNEIELRDPGSVHVTKNNVAHTLRFGTAE